MTANGDLWWCPGGKHDAPRTGGSCPCGTVTRVPVVAHRTRLAYEDLIEMTDEGRTALPAVLHQPVFDGLATPASWICAVCWGDGWTVRWPCEPAVKGGVELATALGLEASW